MDDERWRWVDQCAWPRTETISNRDQHHREELSRPPLDSFAQGAKSESRLPPLLQMVGRMRVSSAKNIKRGGTKLLVQPLAPTHEPGIAGAVAVLVAAPSVHPHHRFSLRALIYNI